MFPTRAATLSHRDRKLLSSWGYGASSSFVAIVTRFGIFLLNWRLESGTLIEIEEFSLGGPVKIRHFPVKLFIESESQIIVARLKLDRVKNTMAGFKLHDIASVQIPENLPSLNDEEHWLLEEQKWPKQFVSPTSLYPFDSERSHQCLFLEQDERHIRHSVIHSLLLPILSIPLKISKGMFTITMNSSQRPFSVFRHRKSPKFVDVLRLADGSNETAWVRLKLPKQFVDAEFTPDGNDADSRSDPELLVFDSSIGRLFLYMDGKLHIVQYS
ncbi:hypothetical protein SISSUDRAFT_435223 [Sistotremastrum suecicum HHB10207 ss-3]|uniref:Uncharacterized protein n=1 Tax=Sistotremastrum suecicum HHB10207 ss-3 TaxID=1314776 RepID=A0A165YFM1_9AGAM|nr:hypothetical protein SISSUDRAFT_435223 [Sistotremastrum suecicum HHB10207 ss-3]